ncbi:MAG: hypothetical protein ACRDG8_04815 [Actinomycetota bacterium]
MRARSGTRNATSTVLSIALFVAIAVFAVLVALQVRGDTPPRFDVSAAEGMVCPAGEGTPACFSFGVTNLGNEPALVECTVTAAPGRAAFLNDAPVYTSTAPFEPGVAEQLLVKVDQGDTGTVTAPTMSCRAV